MPVEKTCEGCGNKFYCYQSEADKGRKYCDVFCRKRTSASPRKDAASRTPVDFTCKECGKSFVMMLSYLTAYRKKFGRDPLYCSMTCSYTGQRKAADERNKFKCVNCGKEEHRQRTAQNRIYLAQKYCSYDCKIEAQKKFAQARFEAGGYKKHVKRHGYIWVSVPMLSRNGGPKAVLEHRYVMSQHLGRELLPEETVHHINGVRSDNRLENLELFNSRHGPGQRVADKVAFAIEILRQYPEFARVAGYELTVVHQP